jgi:hypothetical protein
MDRESHADSRDAFWAVVFGIGLLCFSIYLTFKNFVIAPAPTFLKALLDNGGVTAVFAGSLVTWLCLRRRESSLARACGSVAWPVALGVSPYIFLFYFFSLRPITATLAIASGPLAHGFVARVLALHSALDWGSWTLLASGIVIIVALRFNLISLLLHFAKIRAAMNAVSLSTAVFGAFSAMTPPDIAPWEGAARVELRVMVKPQLIVDAKALVLRRIADLALESQPLKVLLLKLTKQSQASYQIYAELERAAPGESVRDYVPKIREPAKILGQARGTAIAISTDSAQEGRDEAVELSKEVFAGAVADLATLSASTGLAATFLNQVASTVAERVADRLLEILPVGQLAAMIRNSKLITTSMRAAIMRLGAADFIPTRLEMDDFRKREESLRLELSNPELSEKLAKRDEGLREDRIEAEKEWERVEQVGRTKAGLDIK